jgi:hypothetical protein
MQPPTDTEKIAGHLATKLAANAVAVAGATFSPLAAFVPVLFDSLASQRQSERLNATLSEIRGLLAEHTEQLRHVSDDQYKIINEAIAAAFCTTQPDKFQLLKNVVRNGVQQSTLVENLSDALARVVRDISAGEAKFLANNFHYDVFVITAEVAELPIGERIQVVKPGTPDEVLVSGLINLGLLYSKSTRWDAMGFDWSPLAPKLLALIRDA